MMVLDIQAKEVIDKIARDLKVQPALQVPRKLSENIQLIYNVNPERLIKVKAATASDATSATIFTTSATNDTYLIGASISIAKDASSDAVVSAFRVFPFGDATKDIITIRHEPTTAGTLTETISFDGFPILLKRNSIVSVFNNAATASIDTTGTAYFYEVDAQ